MKSITDKLVYCYYRYGVSGLLISPENLLVNLRENNQFKFKHFLTGILLNTAAIKSKDQNVNYIDGIDSKYFIDNTKPFPPEAKLGIHT